MVRRTASTSIPALEATVDKNVFVMMRYRDTDQFQQIEAIITGTLQKAGLHARLAKDVPRDLLLWENIRKYMNACKFGIAVFDSLPRVKGEPRLNPNICTELGYMLAQGKPCLLLKDKKLTTLQSNLQGFIFQPFDGERLDTLQRAIKLWAEQQITVLPLIQAFANLLPESKITRRLNVQPYAKRSIGQFLAEEYFPNVLRPKKIILDSGTSAAAVAEALFLSRDKYDKLDIHTNNLLACLLLCSVAQFTIEVVPGEVDEDFGGVFGSTACAAIRNSEADATVLACTGFTVGDGPYANSEENRNFKRAIIDKTKETIIIVPSERLGRPAGLPVMRHQTDWEKVLADNISMVVTSPRLESKEFKEVETILRRKLKVVESVGAQT